jgi:4'-phosphopantetheinyl transferase
MSQACLSAAEREYLAGQPTQHRPAVFFRCWTRKEAVLKACGVGLATKLEELDVHPELPGAAEVAHSSGTCPDRWTVQDLPGGPDWAGAVAQPASQTGHVLFRVFG